MYGLYGNDGFNPKYSTSSYSKLTINYRDLCESFSNPSYSSTKPSCHLGTLYGNEVKANFNEHANYSVSPISFSSHKEDKWKGDAYEVGREIGSGAYAEVRECILPSQPTKKYAIKIYSKQRPLNDEIFLNIQREIRILEGLNHPNIVKMIESIESSKSICLVFEYLRGGSVTDYIKSKAVGRLDELEGKQMFVQIVKAVQYIHHRSIAHRDLKMDNLLMDEHKNIKLIDFGFSIKIQPGTKLQRLCGTFSYMAPEVINKKGYDGIKADTWSLGVLLYELLTGSLPFNGYTAEDICDKIKRCDYFIPSYVSYSAKQLIVKLLNPIADKRLTCDDILKDDFW